MMEYSWKKNKNFFYIYEKFVFHSSDRVIILVDLWISQNYVPTKSLPSAVPTPEIEPET